MSSFAIPLSGLQACSNALNAISDNLSNLNTDGFKDGNVSFSDTFYQLNGSAGNGDPLQHGTGVHVSQTNLNFNNGTVNSTGIPSNMALQGNGLFVVQKNNATSYTRSGDFTVNSSGQLGTPDGALVMGYPAARGVVSTNSALAPIQVGQGVTIAGQATTGFQTNTNVDASAPVGTISPNTPITVYDSLGTSHILSVQFTKTGSNAWDYNITLPAADTGGTGAATTVATGSMTFDPANGKLLTPAGSVTGINVTGLVDGASPMGLTWNLNDASGNTTITQLSSPSSTSSATQNGYAVGTISGYAVQADGTVEGQFSNGQTMALGQVAVATFANVQGLQRAGNSQYLATFASGSALIGQAGGGGRGTIAGGSVELSNVDVATEFAKMIVAQQGYQANAKVLTTLNQVSQATMQVIT